MEEQEQQNVVNEEQNVQMEIVDDEKKPKLPFIPPPSHKKLIIGIVAGFALVAGIAGAYFVFLPKVDKGPVACTAEAKICPDGSGVGRTGPNCEFAECPVVATEKDYPIRSELLYIQAGNNISMGDYIYSKDINNVYYGSTILEGADTATFQIKDITYSHLLWSSDRGDYVTATSSIYLGYDSESVYYRDIKLEGIDINKVFVEIESLPGHFGSANVIQDDNTKWYSINTDCQGGYTYINELEFQDYLKGVPPC